MHPADLGQQAVEFQRVYGRLGVTVWVSTKALELILPGVPLAPQYPWISVASVGDLGAFELLPTFDAPHFTVFLSSVMASELEFLRSLFRKIRNPIYVPPG